MKILREGGLFLEEVFAVRGEMIMVAGDVGKMPEMVPADRVLVFGEGQDLKDLRRGLPNVKTD